MDRGTYSAASGGLVQLRKLEVVNNNLANVNTPGFKRQLIVNNTQSFDQTLARLVENRDPFARKDQERTPGAVNIQTVTDFTLGPIKDTGNPFDLALRNAKDFFVVNTPDGPQYTRAGNFTLNAEGQLVNPEGFTVQGDGGEINANGPRVVINPDGSVRVNGEITGRIQVVRIEDPNALQRIGGSRFALGDGQAAPQNVEADIATRALEMSNVSTISSMVDLIGTNRAFEMYVRTTQTIDTMNQAAINQIGRRI